MATGMKRSKEIPEDKHKNIEQYLAITRHGNGRKMRFKPRKIFVT